MRGNATLLALVVIAAMTATSLQLWRLWSMHVAVLQERDHWYQQWFVASAGFDGVVCLLQTSFNQYAQQAKAEGRCAINVPEELQKAGVVSLTMQYTTVDLFLVTVSLATKKVDKQTVRFLIEKQPYAKTSSLLVHHVTFGAVV